jgi:hypothetical protein
LLSRLLLPLDRRQQALLLTLLSLGGKDLERLYALIPEEEANALREKAEKLQDIPEEKRVPLMLRQLKQMYSFQAAKGLEGVEPSWLLAGFRGESPRTVAIILMHMPSSISRQILSRLPEAVRDAMPDRESLRELPMELVKLVRRRFDEKFATMPEARQLETFSYNELVVFEARELIILVRKIGMDELAHNFLTIGKRALAAFLGKLPANEVEELMTAIKRCSSDDAPHRAHAQVFLTNVFHDYQQIEELVQKSGLFRLARSLRTNEDIFARQMAQKFPRAHGRLLSQYRSWLANEGHLEELGTSRLRNQIVDAAVELSKRGKVNPDYSHSQVALE